VYQQKTGSWNAKSTSRSASWDEQVHDLTLLKVEDSTPEVAWVPLGDSDALSVASAWFAIGSPLGLERTVTKASSAQMTRLFQANLHPDHGADTPATRARSSNLRAKWSA